MKYHHNVIIRISLAIFIGILGVKLFYPIISPLTFYLSYYSLFFLKPVLINNISFTISDQTLKFIPSCAAASAYLLLALLILLTKDINFKKGVKLFLIGSSIILLVNILRIDFLAYVLLKYGSNLFDTLHNVIWRVISSTFVVTLWLGLSYAAKIKTIPIYSDFKEIKKLTTSPSSKTNS